MKPCPVCCGGKQEYQHTHSTKLFVDAFGQKRVLLVECNGCPPHSDCALKNIPSYSAFVINFCPECGRDLRKRDGVTEKKYIDAEDFKRRVMESAFEANKPDLYDIAKGICEMVDYTSAADVAPVVRGYNMNLYPSLFECSVCGWRDIDTFTGDTSTYNYCPNCGAKNGFRTGGKVMRMKDEYKDYGGLKINNKGKYKLNLAYTEITRLHVMLEENQIPHFFHRIYDGWQVIYPNAENRKISAVQHYFSYGSRENRIEIMGGITSADGTSDSVLGHLTAENVFGRIITMHKAEFSDNVDRCVCCGDVIPEGRQVCPKCGK